MTPKTPAQKAQRKVKRLARLAAKSLADGAARLNASIVPIFPVGAFVNTPTSLYNETEGTITSISRLYRECNIHGQLLQGRLCHRQDELYMPKDRLISNLVETKESWVSRGNKDISYNFESQNLIKQTWKNAPRIFGLQGITYMICDSYSYIIETKKMSMICSERSLSLK